MNVLETIFRNLQVAPDRAKLVEIHATTPRGTDGRGMLTLIARARTHLRNAGVRPGDRVALCAPNSARWVAADLAIMAEGAICVPLYDRQSVGELAKMLGSARPTRMLAATTTLASTLEQAWRQACEADPGLDADAAAVDTFDGMFAAEPSEAPPFEHQQDDTLALIYTSGTSGEPKGVMLSRRNIDFMIERTIDRLDQVTGRRRDQDRVFHYLPFCFAASRIMLWTQLCRPNPLAISTDLDKLVVEIATAKPNYFLNVPTVLARIESGVEAKIRQRGGVALEIYERGCAAFTALVEKRANIFHRTALGLAERLVFSKIRKQIGPDLEFVISGSGPLHESTQRWFQMIGIPVYQAYGLTETTGIVTLDHPDHVQVGHVGTPLEGIDVRISSDGELQVRGENIFTGYWENDQASQAAFETDGAGQQWFRTGDQVQSDGKEPPNLKIVGRLKNLVILESGHNVAPEPLEEAVLAACAGAQQCVVFGHARASLGVLVTGEVSQQDVESALEQINPTLPSYKRVRCVIVSDQTFSADNGQLTANQKLKRDVIESHYRAQIEQAYADAKRARSAAPTGKAEPAQERRPR